MLRRIAALLFALFPLSAAALDVRTAAQDSQPKFIQDGGAITGLCVDVFQALQRADPELKFSVPTSFTPLPRIEVSLEEGSLDAFCGLARTPDREAKLVFIDTPLYMTHSVLVARADDPIQIKSWDDVRKLGDDGSVMVVTKTVHVKALQAVGGLKVDDGAKNTTENLQKLINKRGRFVYHNDFALVDEIKRDGLTGKVRILPLQMASEGRFMVVSKKAPPALLERLKAAIEKTHKSGELAKIFERYAPR